MPRQHNSSLLTSEVQDNVTKTGVFEPDSVVFNAVGVYLDGAQLTV